MIITEGKAKISIPKLNKISKDMGVFYNPVMKANRDIAVLLLNSVENTKMQIADVMAATGIRSIRLLKELDKGKIKEISINDISSKAVKDIKKNLKLNRIKGKTHSGARISVSNRECNEFLTESKGFDYIDIDPFGYPGRYLDAATAKLARGGILAVTATDTAALAGSSPKACIRKYWAKPLRNWMMHETGLRIMIRRIQLAGASYNKALNPILCYYKDHYMRCYFLCGKGKQKTDKIMEQHGTLKFGEEAGPLWLGSLADKTLVSRMAKKCKEKKLKEFLETIKNETGINEAGFYDYHKLCKENRVAFVPGKEKLIKAIKKSGYKASNTHFSEKGIKTNINKEKLVKLIKKNTLCRRR